jgi:hypothetical protein
VVGKQAKYHKPEKGKLYDVETLNQERIDILQEMIDNWKADDANKRKEERKKRASKTKSKKNNSA